VVVVLVDLMMGQCCEAVQTVIGGYDALTASDPEVLRILADRRVHVKGSSLADTQSVRSDL
jgi:hypothetical protein